MIAKFEVSLGYIGGSQASLGYTARPCLEK
jgi:hypothetical protein